MRIGSYKIQGISKRFWLVLALVLVVPIVIFLSLPEEKIEPFRAQPDPALLPQFFSDPEQYLQNIDPEPEWYPIGAASSERSVSSGGGWDPELYNDRIETRIYVPSSTQLDEIKAERDSLVYSKDGVNYYPAFAILPESEISQENRDEWPNLFASGEEATPVIQLASEEVLPQGEYDAKGLLYARSNFLKPLTPTEAENENFASWIPTVLLTEAVPVSSAEAESPAESRAEVNVVMRAEPYEVIVKSLEWAPPGEVRLCLGASNISRFPRIAPPAFAASPNFYLSFNGDATQYPLVLRDEGDSLSSDYETFLERGSDPSFAYFVYQDETNPLPSDIEEVKISFPFAQPRVPISNITLSGADLQEPGTADRYRYSGCA